jgi:hypothetical protein
VINNKVRTYKERQAFQSPGTHPSQYSQNNI